MDKAFYTFQEYLEQLQELNKYRLMSKRMPDKRRVKKDQMDIERLMNDIELLEKGYSVSLNYLVFNDFNLLSNFLNYTNLSSKDIFMIISTAIKFNTRPLDNNLKFFNSALSIDEHYRDVDELNEKIDKFDKEQKRKKVILTKEERGKQTRKLFKKIMHQVYNTFFNKVKKFDSISEVVNECKRFTDIITLNSNYNEKDVESAKVILSKLLINESIVSEITEYLNNNIREIVVEEDKSEEIIKDSPVIKIQEQVKVEGDDKISKQDYHELLSQVLEYYDPESKEFIKPIPYEKIINIVSLLFELGYQEEDVCSFLKKSKGTLNSNKSIRDYSNVTVDDLYNSLYNKFSYYMSSIEGIEEHIENYNNYYNELKAYDPKEEDYQAWYNIWVDEINIISAMIGARYDYEIEKAKSLIKKCS